MWCGSVIGITAGRSISRYFRSTVAIPVACLLLLWVLLAAAVFNGRLDKLRWLSSASSSHRELIESAVLTGAGLIVVLATVLLFGSLMRRVSREIAGLVSITRHYADEQLPSADGGSRPGGGAAPVRGPAPGFSDLVTCTPSRRAARSAPRTTRPAGWPPRCGYTSRRAPSTSGFSALTTPTRCGRA